MRKTTVLAFATAALAIVTIVTDLIRGDAAQPAGRFMTDGQVLHVRTTGALKATSFDAI